MKSGVTSTTFTASFFNKYESEHDLFQPILKAFMDDNNPTLASQLRNKLDLNQKSRLKDYINEWKKVDLEEWDSFKIKFQNNRDEAKEHSKAAEMKKENLTRARKELFQNYAKNPANIAHMTKNEPATKSSAGISSFFNKLKR